MPPPKSEKKRTKAQQGLQEIKKGIKMEQKKYKTCFLWSIYSFWLQIDPASVGINISPLELLLLKSDSAVAC